MRVQVISAYPAVRSGLAALLRAQPGWTVVGEAAPDALVPSAVPPDVVLFDLEAAPDAETFAGWLDQLRPAGGAVLLLPERSHGTLDGAVGGSIGRLVAAAESAGVGLGALGRDISVEEIVAAITAVGAGLLALDRRQAAVLWTPQEPVIATGAHAPALGDEPLTPREREVLQLLAEGLPNKLIAQRLHVSDHTVKFHVSSIMLKLNAASRTEAVTVAARRGLLIL
jgi:DNA-binding NarL/FixJ family response regulator